MPSGQNPPPPTLVGIVLAAGGGSRYGRPKAPVVVDGERLVDRAVRVCREGGCDHILVVLGAWVGDVSGAQVVINRRWATGIASSLRAGLRVADSLAADRALITLVDLPGLTGAAVARVGAAQSRLAVGHVDGVPGHPVMVGREHFRPIGQFVTGDRGARDYLRTHSATIESVDLTGLTDGADLDHRPGA